MKIRRHPLSLSAADKISRLSEENLPVYIGHELESWTAKENLIWQSFESCCSFYALKIFLNNLIQICLHHMNVFYFFII